MPRIRNAWLLWGALSLLLAGWFGYHMLAQDKSSFLIGKTSHGHHQIEQACGACHTKSFTDKEDLQKACVGCHGEALRAADDKHPRRKFTDPRNAERVAVLDARYCVTCHTEHRPERTGAMGVSLPADLCVHCHQDIAKERPSHAQAGFETCGSSGCHNYHDNRGLYEQFLAKHLHEPATRALARLPLRNLGEVERRLAATPPRPLARADADAHAAPEIDADWAASAHARGGVNCSGCHGGKTWSKRVGQAVCEECHKPQVDGFLASRHGMRIAQGLPAMRPSLARLPMRHDAADKEQSCNACHRPHAYDTQRAAVESCLGCHDDTHSRAYKGSPHQLLWQAEVAGSAAPGSGVSCASCHLPRETHKREGLAAVQVQHNQNDNLRPNDKMLRSVCMNCHGLGFSIDALAEPALVRNNFRGPPTQHVPSLDWVERRMQAPPQAQAAASGGEPKGAR